MKHTLSLFALVAALPAVSPALAENTRQMEAHEHGVGALNIALDGPVVAMEFHAPGADIVGFEYGAKSDSDHAAIDAAIARLRAPLDLFVLPPAAGCSVSEARANLEGGGEHEHDEDHHDEHADNKHAHDEDHHDEHADDKHEHDEDHAHADEAGHTEFHANYTLTCSIPEALTSIRFAYFDTFPNAREVEVQMITAAGARAYEVVRADPLLTLNR